jgi:hypothetical protein
MDVLLALILSCSVHFDDHLVEALATKLSLDNQYFVGDLATLDTYDIAHSVGEAHMIVDAILARGGRPAVGYLSVPVAWAARFGRTTDDLFDGCINVGIATAMLSEYDHACTVRPDHHRPHPKRRPTGRSRPTATAALRYCILRRLEIDLDITGIAEHVLPDVAKLDARPPDPDIDSPPARAPVYPDNTDSARLHETADWSNARLFSSPPTARPTSGPTPSAATDEPPSPTTPGVVPASRPAPPAGRAR